MNIFFNNEVANESEKDELKEFVDLSSEEVKNIIGSYLSPETSSDLRLSYENKELSVFMNGDFYYSLDKIKENVFKPRNHDLTFKFENSNIYVLENGETTLFLPYLTSDVNIDKYIGKYFCEELNTTFEVTISSNKKLFLQNLDKHKTANDVEYNSTIKDFFIYYDDYVGCLTIQFLRKKTNQIKSFVYRDYDGDKREDFEFKKL
jgi:hypothetical protein